jgi:hypothetical protein
VERPLSSEPTQQKSYTTVPRNTEQMGPTVVAQERHRSSPTTPTSRNVRTSFSGVSGTTTSRHSSTAVEQGSSVHYSSVDSRSSGSTARKKPLTMQYQSTSVPNDLSKRKMQAPPKTTTNPVTRPTRATTITSGNGTSSSLGTKYENGYNQYRK